MLLLMTSMAFGQGRVAPDLSGLLAKAQHGSSDGKTVKVIVQYRQIPSASHYATMLARGAHLNAKLHMIQGAAFTIPASALADLANDPEVSFVSLDHPLKGMDDYTDSAMNVSTVWNSGYNGTGIGVAVIDSGINDNHPDLWDSTEMYSRVVYHQDFTGTCVYKMFGRFVYDSYRNGTHVAGIIGGNGYRSVV